MNCHRLTSGAIGGSRNSKLSEALLSTNEASLRGKAPFPQHCPCLVRMRASDGYKIIGRAGQASLVVESNGTWIKWICEEVSKKEELINSLPRSYFVLMLAVLSRQLWTRSAFETEWLHSGEPGCVARVRLELEVRWRPSMSGSRGRGHPVSPSGIRPCRRPSRAVAHTRHGGNPSWAQSCRGATCHLTRGSEELAM